MGLPPHRRVPGAAALVAVGVLAILPSPGSGAPVTPPPGEELPAASGPPHQSPSSGDLPGDTARTFDLDAVVVTAERGETALSGSAAAVSRLTSEELARVPQATLADALRRLPGVAVVDFEGGGRDPQVMVRGFYAGGEAEYVVVLLDGVPLNGVESGLVRWDVVPLVAVDRIEVVRGGSSALYGDAAVGAVINIVTRSGQAQPGTVWQVGAGTEGTFRAAAHGASMVLARPLGVFGGFDRTSGVREHAHRRSGRAGLRYRLVGGREEDGPGAGSLTLSALSQWRDFEEPGPLTAEAMAVDPTGADAFYRFDGTTDVSHRAGLDGMRPLGARTRISGWLAAETRGRESTRTIGLSPDFADTQERELDTRHLQGSMQLGVDGVGRPGDRLTLGLDASAGFLDSGYRPVISGPREAYLGAPGPPAHGPPTGSGKGRRAAGALFAHYALPLSEAVRLTTGIRADWLRDRFDPDGAQAPQVEGNGAPPETLGTSHAAVSPRAGLNVRWLETGRQTGRLYVTAGRSFKAPTLDQLFDTRRMPVPFPPFSVAISNQELVPQRGRSVEAGLYHGAALGSSGLTGELSLSAYRMDMRDELDFSLETLSYVNLGESRHQGLEAGMSLHGVAPRGGGDPGAAGPTAFLNLTVQQATPRGGEHHGKQLKAIPRGVVGAGATLVPFGVLETGVLVHHARGIHLDDANTLEHPPYTTVDVRFTHRVGRVQAVLSVRNLLDARYSTTGYPDPAGSRVVYHYPAAGRTLELEIRR